MSESDKALLIAIVGLVASPFLVLLEILVFVLVGAATYRDANVLPSQIATVAVANFLSALPLSLPITALVMGQRARKAIGAEKFLAASTAKALIAQGISLVVIAAVVFISAYLMLLGARVCSLSGCYFLLDSP